MLIQFIPKDKVLKTAIRLIKKSKKSLILTMIMDEEINSQSQNYINLLKKKINSKVIIKRIGFGNRNLYKKALGKFNFKIIPNNFLLKYCSNLNIQRLLISDEKEMIFAVYTNKYTNDKLTLYTKSRAIVNGFLKYFNETFVVSKNRF